MKSPLLFTRMASAIFLLPLISGLSAQTVISSEDFTGFSTGTHSSPSTYDLSASLDTKTTVPGWTGYKVYSAGGEIKLGTADIPGWIETPEISLTVYEGDLFVKFDIARWPDDASSVRVLLNGSQIGETISPPNEFQPVEIPVPGGVSSCKIKFESLAKRFYLDNIRVVAQYTTERNDLLFNSGKIHLYPNPAGDIVSIENISGCNRLIISDLSGKEVISLYPGGEERIIIDISDLHSGTYIIKSYPSVRLSAVKLIKY